MGSVYLLPYLVVVVRNLPEAVRATIGRKRWGAKQNKFGDIISRFSITTSTGSTGSTGSVDK